MRSFTIIWPATTTFLPAFFFLVLSATIPETLSDPVDPSEYYSDEQQPLVPGNFTSATTMPNTVPAFPVAQASNRSTTCHLDLSNELFGGVGDACARGGLDRSRCCPVLAAWLFAAHARSALEVRASAAAAEDDGLPLMPDDNQKCVDSLQSALDRRDIHLPRPNDTCDLVLCFCGIRLHEIGSLRCPAAFNLSAPLTSGVLAGGNATAAPRNATPTAAVRQLEHECRNASYAGCSRCLHSLEKLKTRNAGGRVGGIGGTGGDRATKMFGRDCQLMGLTWLLAKNKTAYIPTVSAVLRAILYSTYPAKGEGSNSYKCSPDQENMPLAVDSLQFQHLGDQESSAQHHFTSWNVLVLLSFALQILLNLLLPRVVWDL